MASAITHFVVGASLALPALRSKAVRRAMAPWSIPLIAGLFAVAPDLDTYLVRPFDVPRGSFFAHRGFFHSALFLALFALTAAVIVARKRPWGSVAALALLWTSAAVTHPLLDMLTDGGPGVLLLYPVSSQRLFFPWRPIRVSPLSVMQFFTRAGTILRSELPFCAAALVIGVTGWIARRR
jgi:inner membrane protein